MTGLNISEKKIWLAQYKVDFRKSHNGLLGEAYGLNLDPFKGDVLIFIGRSRRHIKVLYGDRTGLWVSSKKFTMEAMKTKLKFLSNPSCTGISEGELALVLEGSSYTINKKVAEYSKPA